MHAKVKDIDYKYRDTNKKMARSRPVKYAFWAKNPKNPREFPWWLVPAVAGSRGKIFRDGECLYKRSREFP